MEIPYLTILIGAVIHFIFGFIWYSMPVFGKAWMKLNKITKKEMEEAHKKGESMGPKMISSLISSIIIVSTLYYLTQWIVISDFYDACLFGALIWIGFIATSFMGGVLWEKVPIKLYLIHVTYWLVSMVGLSIWVTQVQI